MVCYGTNAVGRCWDGWCIIAEMHFFLQLFHRFKDCGARFTHAAAASFVPALVVLSSLGFPGPQPLNAQQHLVSPAELEQHIRTASGARQSDLRDVREFFSSQAAAGRLPSALDAARIDEIVPFLNDSELARIADTTRSIDRDLAAGALSNEHLTYIVIALATAVIVILLT